MNDLAMFFELKSCNEVWTYSTFIPLQDIMQAKELLINVIENRKRNQPDFLALYEKETGNYIGEAGIISCNKEANRCVIGYNLLPQYWHKGYATEITKGIIKFAFEELGYERVEALAIEDNGASCRVLEKSGLMKEGTLRHFNKYEAGYRNVNYYGMISVDYFKK